MITLTFNEVDAKLRALENKMKEARDDIEYEAAELAFENYYSDYGFDAINTVPIQTKGFTKLDGTYEDETTFVHTTQGCIAAQWIDLDKWKLHHVTSGFLIGYWYGSRDNLADFLIKLDALLSEVSANPQSEDRALMMELGNKARAMGVKKW